MPKKTRNSTKLPEQSTSSKINHYKGVTRTLRKRVDNLEQRMYEMEQRLNKYKDLLPEEPAECINFGTPKKVDKKEEFLKKYHPSYKEKNE